MKEAIKVLKEKRDRIEGVLTPFNKENNPDAYKKSLKEYEEIKLAIRFIEIVKDNGSPNEHGLWMYNKYMKKITKKESNEWFNAIFIVVVLLTIFYNIISCEPQ